MPSDLPGASLSPESHAGTRRERPSASRAVAAESAPGWRVLYVDDDPIARLMMQATLERLCPEAELALAGSGAEALDWAVTGMADVVVSDMQLGDVHGTALIGGLRRTPGCAGARFVALSGDDSATANALAVGFAEFWLKPVDITEVARQLRRLALQGRRRPE